MRMVCECSSQVRDRCGPGLLINPFAGVGRADTAIVIHQNPQDSVPARYFLRDVLVPPEHSRQSLAVGDDPDKSQIRSRCKFARRRESRNASRRLIPVCVERVGGCRSA